MDRRLDASGERLLERPLRGRDAHHLERRRVAQDPDDGQVRRRSRLLVEHLDGDRVEHAVVVDEPGEREVRGCAEVPVVAAGDDEAVHDGEAGFVTERLPDLRSRTVATGDGTQRERRVREEGVVEPSHRVGLCPAPDFQLPRLGGEDGLAANRRDVLRVDPGRALDGARHVHDRGGADRARPDLEASAVVVHVDRVDERPVRRRARHEREDDEREHRERRARAEARA